MIGCLRTHVRKQPIIALYFEFETVLKFYNLETRLMQSLVYQKVITHASDETCLHAYVTVISQCIMICLFFSSQYILEMALVLFK